MKAPQISLLTFVLAVSLAIAARSQTGNPTGPMAMHAEGKAASVPATTLTLTLAGKTSTLSAADLQTMPQKTITVHNEHTKADESYTGVLLSDLLAKYGFAVDKSTHQQMLRGFLKAEGTDKYWVLYSLTEIEPSEHNGSVLIALAVDGKPLGADGQFKLIDSEDKKPQRWVRNLASITVKAAD